MASYVLCEKKEGVGYIILNAPERKNAFGKEDFLELRAAIYEMDADDDVRVLVIKGAGHCFSAGGNLSGAGTSKPTVADNRDSLVAIDSVIAAIQKIEKPVIAQVETYAVGGGFSLALACDLIFACENAKMSSNFLRVALCPEMGSMLFLPMTVGMYRAKEIWFSGRMIGAQEAYQLGLASKVCSAETIDEEVFEYAKDIAKMPKINVRMMKKITNSTIFQALDYILSCDQQNTPLCLESKENLDYLVANFRKKK